MQMSLREEKSLEQGLGHLVGLSNYYELWITSLAGKPASRYLLRRRTATGDASSLLGAIAKALLIF